MSNHDTDTGDLARVTKQRRKDEDDPAEYKRGAPEEYADAPEGDEPEFIGED